MEGKQYTVYRITAPSGRCYTGYTSLTLNERWRYHKRRAFNGETSDHPFYNEIRSTGGKGFTLEPLHIVSNRQVAMKLEEEEIARIPPDQSLNLSCGGVNDASEGGRIFWERLNQDPAKREEFLKKLSDRKKESDWTDYGKLTEANKQWRHDNPMKAYKMATRALRIANKKKDKKEEADELPLKEKLRHKHRLNEVKSEYVKKVWNNRSEEERKAIGDKISAAAKQNMAGKSVEEKRAITQKARDSIDKEKQGKAASQGIKKWWRELKEDPVRYKEYMDRRNKSQAETRRKKSEEKEYENI